ncbi:MAG: UDP-N-acetylenolpyruvoylglucosamine reductase [Labilithrix sp.]|nr:UDP-N-acetylenolpyruvoylglucosamine reductase [Labilithrix sp.]
MISSSLVRHDIPLAELTTLRLGGPARRIVSPTSESELLEVLRGLDARGEPVLVIGGGSNLVVGDEGWPGTVVRIATRGIVTDDAEPWGGVPSVLRSAAAGEPWDDFVTGCVADGLAGNECLAGIPGLVGATPMQNVGAYGQDVGETITRVRAWDRTTSRIVTFDHEACRFAYRSSVFRGTTRHVILSVSFRLLRRRTSAELRYPELTRALGIESGERAPLGRVRETVVALRRRKGMVLDPTDPDTTSAGSFFTNPIVDAATLAAIRERVQPLLREGEAMPVYPEADGRAKLSAAWLIERAGFTKGYALGRVALSSKHALALTNRGGATTEELIALARSIRDGVSARLGVTLENEPVFVGVRL